MPKLSCEAEGLHGALQLTSSATYESGQHLPLTNRRPGACHPELLRFQESVAVAGDRAIDGRPGSWRFDKAMAERTLEIAACAVLDVQLATRLVERLRLRRYRRAFARNSAAVQRSCTPGREMPVRLPPAHESQAAVRAALQDVPA